MPNAEASRTASQEGSGDRDRLRTACVTDLAHSRHFASSIWEVVVDKSPDRPPFGPGNPGSRHFRPWRPELDRPLAEVSATHTTVQLVDTVRERPKRQLPPNTDQHLARFRRHHADTTCESASTESSGSFLIRARWRRRLPRWQAHRQPSSMMLVSDAGRLHSPCRGTRPGRGPSCTWPWTPSTPPCTSAKTSG
jgi:hypothetical protein